jgi:hypothetical protein
LMGKNIVLGENIIIFHHRILFKPLTQ